MAFRIERRERARREASDFLKYKDSDGRFADFHALRHTFVSNVVRTGAHLKTSQDLARHSTAALTARYTHSVAEDQIDAIQALPDLSPRADQDHERDSASYSSDGGASESHPVQVGAVRESDWHEGGDHPNVNGALALAATTCEDPDLERRDAGAAERGGFENH